MSAADRMILSITDPTINLDPIEIEDQNGDGASTEESNNTENDVGIYGYEYPLIQINSSQLKRDEISYFKMSLSGFMPTLKLVVDDVRNRMTHLDFPKDGDLVCVYMRPNDIQSQREIRIDFDIVKIKVGSSNINSFSLECVMRVPQLFAEKCEAFKTDSSFNHLNSVADNLTLGFASNEIGTNDSMTRIRAFDTNKKFIQDTTLSSYMDDNSFFTSFIDQHYYLNFVNINKQFSEEDDIEQLTFSSDTNPTKWKDNEDPREGVLGDYIFSNSTETKGTNLYIQKFGLENNSGNVWIQNGYKRFCQYFDVFEKEYNSFFVDPLTTNGSEESKIILKGRNGESLYKDQIKHKFVGKQYSGTNGNVHENFSFAKIQNLQNNEEINKLILNVELTRVNHHLYRYQRIPVLIYTLDDYIKPYLNKRNEILGEEGSNDEPEATDSFVETKNEFLSGYYVVSEIHYIYGKPHDGIIQQLKLLKREWEIPGENKNY